MVPPLEREPHVEADAWTTRARQAELRILVALHGAKERAVDQLRLAEDAGISPSTVQEATQRLEGRGLLCIEPGVSGQYSRPNTYTATESSARWLLATPASVLIGATRGVRFSVLGGLSVRLSSVVVDSTDTVVAPISTLPAFTLASPPWRERAYGLKGLVLASMLRRCSGREYGSYTVSTVDVAGALAIGGRAATELLRSWVARNGHFVEHTGRGRWTFWLPEAHDYADACWMAGPSAEAADERQADRTRRKRKVFTADRADDFQTWSRDRQFRQGLRVEQGGHYEHGRRALAAFLQETNALTGGKGTGLNRASSLEAI